MKFYNRSKVVYGLVDENGCLIKDNISPKELKMMLNLHSSVNLDETNIKKCAFMTIRIM